MKKGQAAMEFMLTYGWAVLLVLVAIAVLMYFGVLNAERFAPERCTLPPGFACTNFKATNNSLTLIIESGLGEDFIIRKLDVKNNKQQVVCSITYSNDTGYLSEYSTKNFVITPCSVAKRGEKFKGVIEMTYIDEDDLDRTREGEIVVRVD